MIRDVLLHPHPLLTRRAEPASDPGRVDEAIERAQGWHDANPDAGHHLTAQTWGTLARVLFHLQRGDEAYARRDAGDRRARDGLPVALLGRRP